MVTMAVIPVHETGDVTFKLSRRGPDLQANLLLDLFTVSQKWDSCTDKDVEMEQAFPKQFVVFSINIPSEFVDGILAF